MPVGATQVAVVVALVVTAAYARYVGAFEWLRTLLTDRFIYGVPWGTALVVGLVLAFYLFVQSGLEDWSEPVVVPFRSWSYYYPTGMLASGFAHASPGHLVSNLAGTLVFAPLVEYAWGHYPREDRGRSRVGGDSRRGVSRDWLARPWVRALVAFPVVVLAVSVVTSVLAFGFSLGFSGTVFAFLGLALVYYPLATVVALVANALVATVYRALTAPVLRATADPGPPGPPDWFGINVQAHALGLLIGVAIGVVLLSRRDRRPDAARVLLATLLVTVAVGLYELAWSDGDVYVQYRGVGLVVVLGVALVVTAAAASSARRVVGGQTALGLAVGWLALVGTGTLVVAATTVASVGAVGTALVPVAVLVAILSAPALFVMLVARDGSAVTRRQVATYALLVVVAVVALVSVPVNLTVVPGEPDLGSGTLEVRDYRVTYGERVPPGAVLALDPDDAFGSPDSGVIVASGRREIWSEAVAKRDLAYSGAATVTLGGIGWRETVRVERTGWTVAGNGTAYAVDLHHGDETTRSFVSDPVTAGPTVANHRFAVVPTEAGFDLRVSVDGSVVDEVAIPGAGEAVTVGEVRIATETDDGTERVVVERAGTSVTVAERETYD